MTQTQEQTSVQSAIGRSEQLVDHMGQNIGSFLALTRQRLQQTAMRAGESLASIQTGLTTRSNSQLEGQETGRHVPTGGSPQAEMQRAEMAVDVMGQRLTALASNVGFQLRRMAAYAREGAEDIWAEARYMRSARSHREPIKV